MLTTRHAAFRSIVPLRNRLVCEQRAEIAIVAGDLPLKENIFHFWPLTDVVNNQIMITPQRFLSDDHSDVRHATT